METIIANLVGQWRSEVYNGRSYTVVPISLIVPGVLNGSAGPLLYTPDDTQASVEAWNGVPLVWKHPYKDGKPVSARDPEVWHRAGIGHVYRNQYKDKLAGEAWIDDQLADNVEPRILQAVKLGQKVEISTGLYTRNELAPAGSVYNGTPYTHIARSYRPDHVAVLLDEPGACDTHRGCGLNVNTQALSDEEKTAWQRFLSVFNIFKAIPVATPATAETVPAPTTTPLGEPTVNRTQVIDWLVANCDCWKAAGDKEVLNKLPDDKLNALKAAAEKAKQNEAIVNAAEEGFYGVNTVPWNEQTGKWKPKQNGTTSPSPVANSTDGLRPAPAAPALTSEQLEDLEFARNEKNRQKGDLITRIVANMPEAQRTSEVVKLQGKSLSALQEIVSYLPPPATPVKPLWFGGSGVQEPVGNAAQVDEDDVLIPPGASWNDAQADDDADAA